ncbi:MAG: single-stranded DNA-binding protein [Candidatus Pacebacteria bacterium CG_4_10_14_0_8_um_filter_43_12]|nr:MAG: single-stranded DNA-binding protein [Candidatus Pacebacteria bacterium CG10_big_fil_rev_8_21_14_0_10_44_11]PIY79081.1 MAG: single-stranded DNA-binding protein [Candidatus Pacebacteria bacterium CG_4_10_14_0_8_um_filter_43_12]
MSVRSLNKVLLIGNLTRDPNLRYTPNSTAVCSFGIATNRSWTPADGGEKQERVEYHNIVAWSKLADICGQILHKGDKVYVEGRLQTRDWKGEDGTDRKTTEVVIDNMISLRSARGFQGEDSGDSYGEAPMEQEETVKPKRSAKKESAPSDQVEEVEDVADDVPF